MKKSKEEFYNNDFTIVHNLEYTSHWQVIPQVPEQRRTLDEHIKVYERLIKDLKSLKEE